MPNTYVALYSNTLTSNTASVTISLSGISGYTDLRLVINGGATAYGGCRMQFNADTASNYSDTYILGNGSSAASGRDTSLTYVSAGYPLTTTLASLHTVDFMNYANTTTNKTILGRSSDAASITLAQVGLWRSTAAITSILLYPASGNFLSGSTFSLYGIANTDQSAAKATGGIITEDATYWYHTFGATGAFIPKQSLTCDVLVVAGGGGNIGRFGGGGGAGGLVYTSSVSFASAISYTATIGAGGNGGANGSNSNVTGGSLSLTAAVGGGYGGNISTVGASGGSGGGGGGYSNNTAGSATTGQGNPGGAGANLLRMGGGGGGAGATGAAAATNAGNGGNGSSAYSSWGSATGTGQNVSGTYWYAGGGGGGSYQTAGEGVAGSGGSGGGGAGNTGTSSGTNGTANTGGGAGGSGEGANSSSGGSGIVIVRYAK